MQRGERRDVAGGRWRLSGALAGLVGLALLGAGCTPAPDLRQVVAESARSVKRYDTVQALAGNGQTVVAGTQSGALLSSADQGKTWQRQALAGASLVGLSTCPDGRYLGIDFYRRVWFGSADAKAWTPFQLEKPHTPLAVSCDAQGRWWVAGTGSTIARSTDQGQSWHYTDLGEDAQLTAIQFFDAGNGVAVGEFGRVLASQDGGMSWHKAGQIPGEFYPYAALFTDRQHGWVSGIAGQVLYTADGGKSWVKQGNTTQAALYRLFLHDGRPYGVGASGVLARFDAGAWRGMPYPDAVPVFLGAATPLPGQSAVAIGGPGGLLRVLGTKTN